jgi:5-methylcytosine-specific restriction endonuclease McrA
VAHQFILRDPISRRVRAAVIARDGRKCQLCRRIVSGDQRLHLHHWLAAEFGGPSSCKNLAVTHEICNLRVGMMDRARAKKLARAMYPDWVSHARLNRVYRACGLPPPRSRLPTSPERLAAKRRHDRDVAIATRLVR